MFCIHCGQNLPSEACFCLRCGRKVAAVPDTPEGTPVTQSSPPPVAPTDPPPKIDCGFMLAITAVVLGNVIGIVALFYASKASDMLRTGDYEGARRAARTGKIWSWTAIILTVAGIAAGILLLPRLVDLIAPGLTLIEV